MGSVQKRMDGWVLGLLSIDNGLCFSGGVSPSLGCASLPPNPCKMIG